MATIAASSKESGVSVGNIYKYYKGKEDIFYSIVPERFVGELQETVKNKILTWKDEKARDVTYVLMNESLSALMTHNRERMIILFSGCKDTRYENFRETLIDLLIDVVMSSYEIETVQRIGQEGTIQLLRIIYNNLINMISKILLSSEKEQELISLLSTLNKYHSLGIAGIIYQSSMGVKTGQL